MRSVKIYNPVNTCEWLSTYHEVAHTIKMTSKHLIIIKKKNYCKRLAFIRTFLMTATFLNVFIQFEIKFITYPLTEKKKSKVVEAEENRD